MRVETIPSEVWRHKHRSAAPHQPPADAPTFVLLLPVVERLEPELHRQVLGFDPLTVDVGLVVVVTAQRVQQLR